MKTLGRFYVGNDALWVWDHDPKGFRWIDCTDSEQSVIAFLRVGTKESLVCVFNFTPVPRGDYRIGVPEEGVYREAVDSDAEDFGGSNLGNLGHVRTEAIPCHGLPHSVVLTLPPLGALVLKLDPDETKRVAAPEGDGDQAGEGT